MTLGERKVDNDAGVEAALLAHEVARPVRMQWMRHEKCGCDSEGPSNFKRALRMLASSAPITIL